MLSGYVSLTASHFPSSIFRHSSSSLELASMSTVSASTLRFSPFFSNQVNGITSTAKAAFVSFPSLRTSRIRITCSAKPETVEKVCGIVRKQLALSDETALTPASKFSDLGADSLDTVEIVMGLEEEFGISVEEENSQNITTIQEAADLIEKLVQVTPNA